MLVVALVVGLVWWRATRPESYADRDWSAVPAVPAAVPAVRSPDAATTRTRLAALDPCALGAAGDPDASGRAADDGSCTVRRGDGTVVVYPQVRYLVDASRGPAAVNALDSRDRVAMAGVATWVGDGPVGEPVTARPAACAVVVPASLELALAFVAESSDCTVVTRTAQAALAQLAPTSGEPLFYAADEPDPGGTGGCAELGDQLAWLCAPATGRAVPDDPVDALRQGAADPDVLCTAALDAAEANDLRMLAVTTATGPQRPADRASYRGPRQCTLLEPTQDADDRDSITISLTASREPLETQGNTTVAGHPAYHHAAAGTWDVALTEPTERGYLSIQVVRSASDGSRDVPEVADALVTDLVERLLG